MRPLIISCVMLIVAVAPATVIAQPSPQDQALLCLVYTNLYWGNLNSEWESFKETEAPSASDIAYVDGKFESASAYLTKALDAYQAENWAASLSFCGQASEDLDDARDRMSSLGWQ